MKKLLIGFIILFNTTILFGQGKDSAYVVNALIHNYNLMNPIDKEVDQLVVEFQWDFKSHPMVMGLEKENGIWKMAIAPVRASIGRSGSIGNYGKNGELGKREGDGYTPEGFFKLGKLFSYDSIVPTELSHIVVNKEDKWIDDSASDDYNKYIRGATTAKSYEHLLLKSIDYKYCMVIEYNTDPVVKGKGSAIFFHIATEDYKPTSGCIAIAEKDMLAFLNWLKPNTQKAIAIQGVFIEVD